MIGGVTEEQNKGADAANQSSKKKGGKEQNQETQEESENGTDSADVDVSENAADENGENPAEENNDAGQDAGNDKKENGQKADAKDPGGDAADQEDTASASNTCTISISCATILDNIPFKEQQGRVCSVRWLDFGTDRSRIYRRRICA